MPFGQFTGYEPVAPEKGGGYVFNTVSGKPLRFGGDAAEQLKARLDASANLQPKVAGPGGGPIDQIGNYGGANTPPSPDQFRAQLPGAEAPPPSIASPAPAPGGALGYGLRVSPQGTIQKFAPGSAGVTQQQLAAQADKGTVLPTAQSDTVQGAIPADPEYLEARTQMNLDKRQALDKEREAAVAAGESEAALAEQQFTNQARLQAEEQARVRDLETRVAGEEQLKDKAFAEYRGSKVEPNRIFQNPAAMALGAIASAAGAYAATLSKSPNFAQQIIDSSINRDIAAQEAAIRIKGEAAGNALSNLRQSGMTLEQSRAALKGLQLEYQRSELAKLRAKNAVPQMQEQYGKLDLALQESLLEANEQYRRESIGKTMRTVSSQVAYPKAGSAGGWVDAPDQLGTAQKIQGLKKGEVEIAKDQAAAAKGPTASPEKRQAMSALADATALEKTLRGYDDDDVAPTTEARNIIGRNLEGAIDTVAGKGAGARATLTERDRRLIQDSEQATRILGSLESVLGGQGALSGPERDAFIAGNAPGATIGEKKRAIAALRSRAELKLQAAEAAGEPGGTVITK